MTTKTLSTDISRDLKRFIWLNIALVVTALSGMAVYTESTPLISGILEIGILAGVATHIFISRYYSQKTETKLNESYEQTAH